MGQVMWLTGAYHDVEWWRYSRHGSMIVRWSTIVVASWCYYCLRATRCESQALRLVQFASKVFVTSSDIWWRKCCGCRGRSSGRRQRWAVGGVVMGRWVEWRQHVHPRQAGWAIDLTSREFFTAWEVVLMHSVICSRINNSNWKADILLGVNFETIANF